MRKEGSIPRPLPRSHLIPNPLLASPGALPSPAKRQTNAEREREREREKREREKREKREKERRERRERERERSCRSALSVGLVCMP